MVITCQSFIPPPYINTHTQVFALSFISLTNNLMKWVLLLSSLHIGKQAYKGSSNLSKKHTQIWFEPTQNLQSINTAFQLYLWITLFIKHWNYRCLTKRIQKIKNWSYYPKRDCLNLGLTTSTGSTCHFPTATTPAVHTTDSTMAVVCCLVAKLCLTLVRHQGL